MKLYVVMYQIGGYKHHDPLTNVIAGIYSDPKTAEYVKIACNGKITEVSLDVIPEGFVMHMDALGISIDTLKTVSP